MAPAFYSFSNKNQAANKDKICVCASALKFGRDHLRLSRVVDLPPFSVAHVANTQRSPKQPRKNKPVA